MSNQPSREFVTELKLWLATRLTISSLDFPPCSAPNPKYMGTKVKSSLPSRMFEKGSLKKYETASVCVERAVHQAAHYGPLFPMKHCRSRFCVYNLPLTPVSMLYLVPLRPSFGDIMSRNRINTSIPTIGAGSVACVMVRQIEQQT